MGEIIKKIEYSDALLSHELGKSGTGSVDICTGRLKFQTEDITFNFGDPALSVYHIYDSAIKVNENGALIDISENKYGFYGNGFRLSVEKRIFADDEKIILMNADGTTSTFLRFYGSKRYLARCGILTDKVYVNPLSLTGGFYAESGAYVYFDEKGSSVTFTEYTTDSAGNRIYAATEFKNNVDKTIKIKYENKKPAEIYDDDRKIYLYYNTGGLLTKMSDSTGRRILYYKYDAHRNLLEISRQTSAESQPNGDPITEKCMEFGYSDADSGNGNLISVTNATGNRYAYEYDDKSRVTKIIKQRMYDSIDRAGVHYSGAYEVAKDVKYTTFVYRDGECDRSTTARTNTAISETYHFKTEDGAYYYTFNKYEGERANPVNGVYLRDGYYGERMRTKTKSENLLPAIGDFDTEKDASITDNTAYIPSAASIYKTIENTAINGDIKKISGGMYIFSAWAMGTQNVEANASNEKIRLKVQIEAKYEGYNAFTTLSAVGTQIDGKIDDWQFVAIPFEIAEKSEADKPLEFLRVTLSNVNENYVLRVCNVSFAGSGVSKTKSVPQFCRSYMKEDGSIAVDKAQEFIGCRLAYQKTEYKYSDDPDTFTSVFRQLLFAPDGRNVKFVDGLGNSSTLGCCELVYDISESEDGNGMIVRNEAGFNSDGGETVTQKIWHANVVKRDNLAFISTSESDDKHRFKKASDYRGISNTSDYMVVGNVENQSHCTFHSQTDENGYSRKSNIIVTATQSEKGAVIKEWDERDNATSYDNNYEKDYVSKVTMPDGTVYEYEYDEYRGLVTKLKRTDVYEEEPVTVYEYSYTEGVVTSVATGDGEEYYYTYDGNGNVIKVEHKVRQDVNTIYSAEYKEDANYAGDVNYSVVTKNGKSVKSELDKYGKIINVYEKSEQDDEFPEQPIASYSYDGVTGELIESQDNTVGSKWTMNTNSYFTTVKHKGATNYEKTVYLDKSIPTTEEITVDDSIFTYTYAYETNATGLRYPDNRISEIKISGLEGNAVCKYTPHYDNIGRFSKDEICPSEGNGPAIVSHEYEYPQKPNGRTENLVKKVTATDRVAGSASENTTEYSYEYDANGNITKIIEDGKVITYEYDGKQRLVRENNEISDTTTVYNYYDNGNLRFKSEMAYTDADLDLRPHVTDEYYESAPFWGQTICGTSVCAEKTQLHIHTEELAGKTPTRYDYDYLNRLTMINGEVIAEYANDCDLGKPTKYKGKQLSWDGNKLTSVTKNGKVRTFNYDVRNYLVSAVTDGDASKFFYDEKGNLLREERTKNGVNYKVNYIYAGGEAIGFTLRGQWKIDLDGAKAQDFPFYYVKDAQGNVRKIVDRMGNCVVKYNYNAWGKETVTPVESTWEFPLELNSDGTVKKFCQASDIAELNRLTYRGYFYNREIGLYYLINRYYDPETGRFISADDAEYLDFQTLYGSNRYIYCLNNPVNNTDPKGTFAAVDDLAYIAIFAFAVLLMFMSIIAFESATHILGNAMANIMAFIEDVDDKLSEGAKGNDEQLGKLQQTFESIAAITVAKAAEKVNNGTDYHHIVAKRDHRVVEARAILFKYDIGINSKANLVELRRSFHWHVHTNAYHSAVNESVKLADITGAKNGVLTLLATYKSILSEVGGPKAA